MKKNINKFCSSYVVLYLFSGLIENVGPYLVL